MRAGFIAGIPRRSPDDSRRGRRRPTLAADPEAEVVTVTTHPSAILCHRDEAERGAAMDAFASDLRAVADWLADD
jgi:hypothetical protein